MVASVELPQTRQKIQKGTTTMRKILLFTAAAAVLSVVSAAYAGGLGRPCTAAPQTQWLPIEKLQAKLEALGYKVRNGSVKNACGEFYAFDKNGSRVELFVDPTSGDIVGQL
jgi:hypothetical protein